MEIFQSWPEHGLNPHPKKTDAPPIGANKTSEDGQIDIWIYMMINVVT